MNRYATILLALSLLGCPLKAAAADDSVPVPTAIEGTAIQPEPAEGMSVGTESAENVSVGTEPAEGQAFQTELAAEETPQKRGFFRRVFDYFDGSAIDKTFEKKMDFTFVAGPSYSSKTSLSIGVLAAGLYRVDRTDSLSSPSNISIFGNFAISGYYYIGISGNTFFKRNKHRIDYELGFRSQPSAFWGLGYDAINNTAGSYTAKKYIVDVQYKYALLKYVYVGGAISFNHTMAKGLTKPEYLMGQDIRYTATGIGTFIEYDSRDIVTSPFKGIYASVRAMVYPKGLGNCGNTLWKVKVTMDWYQKLWRDAVLAFDLYGEFSSDRTPWTMNAMLGGNWRMRGYYEGRFNDLDLMSVQVELRQRIYRRIGCTVWGGAGNVFHSFREFDWSKTLPNYGIGLRWELKKRMNVRFDYGFGKKVQGKRISGFIMSINEAF